MEYDNIFGYLTINILLFLHNLGDMVNLGEIMSYI